MKWSGHFHTIDEYLLYIQDYLTEAIHWSARQDFTVPENTTKSLDIVRKITTLGIACMEQHGAPKRKLPSKSNGSDKCLCGGVGCNSCEPQGR
jgi:hypothetical protein